MNAPHGSAPDPVAHRNHLTDLAAGWTVWRTFCLRSAGFDVAQLAPLVAAPLETALTALWSARARRDECLRRARDCVWVRQRSAAVDERRHWRAVLRRLDKAALSRACPDDAELNELLERFAAAHGVLRRAENAFDSAFEAAAHDTSSALREFAAAPRVREAICWQNRHAVTSALAHLLRQASDCANSRTRQNELLVARYLQRYCMTNESIGFFGPIGWGEFSDQDRAVTFSAGAELTKAAVVRFEYWVIDALVDRLVLDPRMRAAVCPRLSPQMRIDGSELIAASGQRQRLNSGQVTLLRLLDGTHKPASIANTLQAPRATVLATLDRLVRSGVVHMRPPIPVGEQPERALQAVLDGIDDDAARHELSAPLARLSADRDELMRARGDAVTLEAAMTRLETDVHQLTGAAAERHSGQAYAGRTPVYLDCLRDIQLDIGAPILASLGPPLALLLLSARWFSWRLAARYLDFVRATLRQCRRESGRSAVGLAHLWSRLQGDHASVLKIVDDVVAELQARWLSILGPSVNPQAVTLASAAISARVHEQFAAPHPGWPGARHHSPDVMIAAAGVEEILAGDYSLVLGEIHTGGNSVLQNVFSSMHPDPATLVDALENDQQAPELVPVYARRRHGHRMLYDPRTRHDFHIAFDDTASWRSPDQVLPIASLVVDTSDTGLTLCSRDGAHEFPAIAFFGPQLRGLCVNNFQIRGHAPHSARVTIDKLVVCREAWRFPLDELGFDNAKPPAWRYEATRSWAQAHGIPRRFFMRVSGERKPSYVDLWSPVSVALFLKMLRGAAREDDAELSVSEMLPTPEQCWLHDADGRRYTSELRLVALDPCTYPESAERGS